MHRRYSLLLLALATFASLSASACDLPSGVPNWDTTWNVPSQSLSVGVAQVLPSGVTLSPDGSAFIVSIAPATFTERLSDDCTECNRLNGFVAPKPAFDARVSTTTDLPADIRGGMLAAGARIDVRIANGNTFDPLRPSATPYGWATIVVRSGETVLARDSVNGATTPLPAGAQLVRSLTLGAATITTGVTVDLTLHSPAGDPITIDASRSFVVTATPSAFRVTQATVMVRSAQVSQTTTADLDVSTAVSDRVQGGRLLVDVTDPFAVRGLLAVKLAGAQTIAKSIDVQGGNKSYAISFSRDELRSLLGRSVGITFTGPVSVNGAVTVTPTQTIGLRTRFELVLTTNND